MKGRKLTDEQVETELGKDAASTEGKDVCAGFHRVANGSRVPRSVE